MNKFTIAVSFLLLANVYVIDAETIYVNPEDIDFATVVIIPVCIKHDCKGKEFYDIPDHIVCPKGWIGKVYNDNGRYKVASYMRSKVTGQPFKENCNLRKQSKMPNYMRQTISSSAKTVPRTTTQKMTSKAELELSDLISEDLSLISDDLSFKTIVSSNNGFPYNMVDGSDDVVWGLIVFVLSWISTIVSFLLRKAKKNQKKQDNILPIVNASTPKPEQSKPCIPSSSNNLRYESQPTNPSLISAIRSVVDVIPQQQQSISSQSTEATQVRLENSRNTRVAPQTSGITSYFDARTQQQESSSQGSSYYPEFTASVTPSYASIATNIFNLATNLANVPANFKGCSCKGECIKGPCNCHKYNIPCSSLCHNGVNNENCKRNEAFCIRSMN